MLFVLSKEYPYRVHVAGSWAKSSPRKEFLWTKRRYNRTITVQCTSFELNECFKYYNTVNAFLSPSAHLMKSFDKEAHSPKRLPTSKDRFPLKQMQRFGRGGPCCCMCSRFKCGFPFVCPRPNWLNEKFILCEISIGR